MHKRLLVCRMTCKPLVLQLSIRSRMTCRRKISSHASSHSLRTSSCLSAATFHSSMQTSVICRLCRFPAIMQSYRVSRRQANDGGLPNQRTLSLKMCRTSSCTHAYVPPVHLLLPNLSSSCNHLSDELVIVLFVPRSETAETVVCVRSKSWQSWYVPAEMR